MKIPAFSIFKKAPKLPDPVLVQRGKNAAELLRSELFHTVMEDLEATMWKQFMETPANTPEAREVLYTHISALGYIKQTLQAYADKGKLAAHQEKIKGSKK